MNGQDPRSVISQVPKWGFKAKDGSVCANIGFKMDGVARLEPIESRNRNSRAGEDEESGAFLVL